MKTDGVVTFLFCNTILISRFIQCPYEAKLQEQACTKAPCEIKSVSAWKCVRVASDTVLTDVAVSQCFCLFLVNECCTGSSG